MSANIEPTIDIDTEIDVEAFREFIERQESRHNPRDKKRRDFRRGRNFFIHNRFEINESGAIVFPRKDGGVRLFRYSPYKNASTFRRGNGQQECFVARDGWSRPDVQNKGSRVRMREEQEWWDEAEEALNEIA